MPSSSGFMVTKGIIIYYTTSIIDVLKLCTSHFSDMHVLLFVNLVTGIYMWLYGTTHDVKQKCIQSCSLKVLHVSASPHFTPCMQFSITAFACVAWSVPVDNG